MSKDPLKMLCDWFSAFSTQSLRNKQNTLQSVVTQIISTSSEDCDVSVQQL